MTPSPRVRGEGKNEGSYLEDFMQPIAFYYQHLENVSRSFSFCIMQLLSPAKEWVALSYLLCRIVDTIEDSKWPNRTLQSHAFQQMHTFLSTPPSAGQFRQWLATFPDDIPLSEKKLLADLPLLLTDIQELPIELQRQLFQSVQTMMQGMCYFINNNGSDGAVILPSLTATNQYCFFVAGVVGELLTRLFTYLIPQFAWSDSLLIQSFHFGLFLQKVNILKDQGRDAAAGRCYIASRDSLQASLQLHAREALQYIHTIPIVAGRTYRLFCAWSLFIGLASLKWINKSWQMNDAYKIGGREMRFLMNQIIQRIDDNYALECLFERYLSAATVSVPTYWLENDNEKLHIPLWFKEIYPYSFSDNALVALGIGVGNCSRL